MSDHDVIWLQPWCPTCDASGESRQWCQDNVWDQCDICERRPVKYVIERNGWRKRTPVSSLGESND